MFGTIVARASNRTAFIAHLSHSKVARIMKRTTTIAPLPLGLIAAVFGLMSAAILMSRPVVLAQNNPIPTGSLNIPRSGHTATDEIENRQESVQPVITTSELAVGRNRFAFGLLLANNLIEAADV